YATGWQRSRRIRRTGRDRTPRLHGQPAVGVGGSSSSGLAAGDDGECLMAESLPSVPGVGWRGTRLLVGYAAVAGSLVIWQAVGRNSSSGLVPPVSVALGEAWAFVSGSRLIEDVVPSVLRILGGFVLGSVTGAGLGIVLGYFR